MTAPNASGPITNWTACFACCRASASCTDLFTCPSSVTCPLSLSSIQERSVSSFDGDPRAAYAPLDDDRIEIRRVAYDVEDEISPPPAH
jgi:hypothetical protein